MSNARTKLAKGPASTLELARVVSAARNALEHGGWSALWKSTKMPFCKRAGDHLVAVGNGLGWANARVCAHLPAALRTLCHLAKLDRITVERPIEKELIHPALKEAEARDLVARFTGERAEAKTPRAKIRQWLQRSRNFVRENRKDWQPEERKVAIDGLTQLIKQIGPVVPLEFAPEFDPFGCSIVQDAGAGAPRIVSPATHPN